MQHKEITQVISIIRRKHWRKFKKETLAALSGAIIYHTWRARNWRRYKGKLVHTTEAITLIKKELVERIKMYSSSKKAQQCRKWIQQLDT